MINEKQDKRVKLKSELLKKDNLTKQEVMSVIEYSMYGECTTIELQANQYGYTFGKYADRIQNLRRALFKLDFNELVTKDEYKRILERIKKFGNKHLHKKERRKKI